MERKLCLNFCEILENIVPQAMNLETVIPKITDMAGYKKCERIYIGSYFCSQYLLHLSIKLIEKVIAKAMVMGIKVTFVLPMFTEIDLISGKEKLEEISHYFNKEIDEITVNDYGMLEYIHQRYHVNINLGRLLFKDYRDPRYEEYFMQVSKPKYFTKYLAQLCEQYQVTGLELDISHKKMNLSDAPSNVELSIHAPYSYMTVGMVCEYASIPYEITKKFRPNIKCKKECLSNRIVYYMLANRKYLKIGRTVFFHNKDGEIVDGVVNREIYSPIDMEEMI